MSRQVWAELDEPDAARRWLIDPLRARAGVGIIGGAPKCGESYLHPVVGGCPRGAARSARAGGRRPVVQRESSVVLGSLASGALSPTEARRVGWIVAR